MANSNNKRILKSGSYLLVVSVILIAIVIAVNLIISSLPESKTQIDISQQKLYTIGEVTEEIVNDLKDDVSIYYIVEAGKEDAAIEKILTSYDDLSDKITISKIDPAVNPNFTSEYTNETLSSNSIIVKSEKRNTVVNSDEFYRFNVDGYGELSYADFYQLMTQYSQYYGTSPNYEELFYAEQAITSAINYVTTDTIPSLYYTTGHGESALDSSYTSYVSAENYNYQALALLAADIPADAEAILINTPTYDMTADETAKLFDYVKAGGDVVFISDYSHFSAEKLPNIAEFLVQMGMKADEGMVFEGDPNYYYPSAPASYFILPIIGENVDYSPVSKLDSSNVNVFMPGSHGISIVEGDNVKVTDILHTSDKAFIKRTIDENTDMINKQEGDAAGSFIVAAASQYTDGGKVVWYASNAIIDSSADNYVSRGNSSLFIATLNLMAGKSETISIIGKSINNERLSVTEASVGMWRIILCVIIPVAILGSGLVVWIRRRRR